VGVTATVVTRRHPRTPPALLTATAVFAAFVVLAVCVLGSAWRRDRAAAQRRAWPARLEALFRPPTEGLPNILSGLKDWRAGTRDGADLARDLDGAVAAYAGLPHKVESLPRHPARAPYRSAAGLYLEFLRLERAATDLPAESLRGQADLTARRVLVLADRVFDRGRMAADPTALDQPAPGGGEIRYPDDVPDWAAEGLAAGPPLAATWSGPVGDRPIRPRFRPEQSDAGWHWALTEAGIPASTELAAAMARGDGGILGRLADAFATGAARLHAAADPPHGRERAATAALGVLVEGEAARAAQVGVLAGGRDSALDGSARRLAAIGAELRREARAAS